MTTRPLLTSDFPAPPEHLDALRSALAARAGTEGLVEIAYRTIDSPVGRLLLASTGTGLARVAFEVQGFDAALEQLARVVSPRLLEDRRRLDPVATALDEYFHGTRTEFDLPLDHVLSAGFRLEVQRHLPSIAYGDTATYKETAAAAGRPRAVRAVGTACATNPLPVVLPCHRVLRADGGLGGYAGGLEAKRWLLAHENRDGGSGDRHGYRAGGSAL